MEPENPCEEEERPNMPGQDQNCCNCCPIDLPPNVGAQLQLESVGNIQATNQQGRGISTMATGVLQAAMARRHDELGPVESRAVSGVLATPVAGPTTQQ